MIYSNFVIVLDEGVSDEFIDRYSLVLNDNSDDIEIYTGKTNESDNILVIELFKGFNLDRLTYVLDNFQFLAISVVGTTNRFSDFDYNSGDIILPNTFTSLESESAIFLEPNIGANYDLNNFGLILSGICLSNSGNNGENNYDEDGIDIIVNNIYDILTVIKSKSEVNIKVIELLISDDYIENKGNYINNLFLILDVFLND